jgi:hypothetical protein
MLFLTPLSPARSSSRSSAALSAARVLRLMDDNDAAMTLRLRQVNQVLTIAGHQQAIVFVSEVEDRGIRGLHRQHVAQPENLMIQFSEQVAEIVWYVLVEQELHC